MNNFKIVIDNEQQSPNLQNNLQSIASESDNNSNSQTPESTEKDQSFVSEDDIEDYSGENSSNSNNSSSNVDDSFSNNYPVNDFIKQQSSNMGQQSSFGNTKSQILQKEKSMPNLRPNNNIMTNLLRKQSIIGGINKSKICIQEDEQERDNMIHILQNPEKSNAEKNYLKKAFQSLPLFKDKKEIFLQNPESIYILINEIKYRFYPKNTEVIRFGEYGTKYYIIIKGSCNVLVPKKEKINDEEEKPENMRSQTEVSHEEQEDPNSNNNSIVMGSSNINGQNVQQQQSPQNSHMNKFQNVFRASKQFQQKMSLSASIQNFQSKNKLQPNASRQSQHKKAIFHQDSSKKSLLSQLIGNLSKPSTPTALDNKYEDFHKVAVTKAGQGFGEIALITKQRRTATVVANEDTHMIEFSKQSYEKLFAVYQKYQLLEKMNFYKGFSFLEKMPNSTILSLVLDSEIQTFDKHCHVYKKNDEAKHIFFIRSGEIEISTDIQKDQDGRNGGSDHNISKYNTIEQQRDKKLNKKKITLGILGPNTYFGDEEILLKLNHRTSDAIVTSKAQVYSIKKELLLTKLSWWNSLEEFRTYGENKTKFHDQRIKSLNKIDKIKDNLTNTTPQKSYSVKKAAKKPKKIKHQEFVNQHSLPVNPINKYINQNSFQENLNLKLQHSPSFQSPQTSQRLLPYIIETKSPKMFSERNLSTQNLASILNQPQNSNTNNNNGGQNRYVIDSSKNLEGIEENQIQKFQLKSYQRENRQNTPSIILNNNTNNMLDENPQFQSKTRLPLSPQHFNTTNNNNKKQNFGHNKSLQSLQNFDSLPLSPKTDFPSEMAKIVPFYDNNDLNKQHLLLQRLDSKKTNSFDIFLSARTANSNTLSQITQQQQQQQQSQQNPITSQEISTDFYQMVSDDSQLKSLNSLSLQAKKLEKNEKSEKYYQQLQQIKQKSNKQLETTLNLSLKRRKKYLKQLNSHTTSDYFLPCTTIKQCLHERDFFRVDCPINNNSNSHNNTYMESQMQSLEKQGSTNNIRMVYDLKQDLHLTEEQIKNKYKTLLTQAEMNNNSHQLNTDSSLKSPLSPTIPRQKSQSQSQFQKIQLQSQQEQEQQYQQQKETRSVYLQLDENNVEKKDTNKKGFHYQQSKNAFFLQKQKKNQQSQQNLQQQQSQQQQNKSQGSFKKISFQLQRSSNSSSNLLNSNTILSPKSSAQPSHQTSQQISQKSVLEDMLKQNNNNYDLHIQKQNEKLLQQQQQQKFEQLKKLKENIKQAQKDNIINITNGNLQQNQQQLPNQSQNFSVKMKKNNTSLMGKSKWNIPQQNSSQIMSPKLQHSSSNKNINVPMDKKKLKLEFSQFNSHPVSKSHLDSVPYINNYNNHTNNNGQDENGEGGSKRVNIRSQIIENILAKINK